MGTLRDLSGPVGTEREVLELANIKKAETEVADLEVLAPTTEVKVHAAFKVEVPATTTQVPDIVQALATAVRVPEGTSQDE